MRQARADLEQAKKEKEEALRLLEEIKAQKGPIEQPALKRQSSEDFRAPNRPTSSLRSDSAASSAGSPSDKVQFSLRRFWGTSEQKAADSPVLAGAQMGKTRVQRSPAMQQLVEARREFEEKIQALKSLERQEMVLREESGDEGQGSDFRKAGSFEGMVLGEKLEI